MNSKYKKIIIIVVLFAAIIIVMFFLLSLRATYSSGVSKIDFQIQAGERFSSIAVDLRNKNLIRSSLAFEILAALEGRAADFKPGDYELNANLSSWEIIGILTAGSQKEVSVVIPEGSDLAEIDAILSGAQVLRAGALVDYQKDILNSSSSQNLEGYLFPDTYNFFIGSNIETVVGKFLSNFNQKALGMLSQDKNNFKENLILASLVEKEAADYQSRTIIAGILKKRLESHMPLQIDATICYVKEQTLGVSYKDCYPIKASDLKIKSPYNTYLNVGLPPAPISNPGLSAIEAVINSKDSPYWYYLSDPKTGKIIFAENYEEQQKNELKYLNR
jgi:UPF0755 protein